MARMRRIGKSAGPLATCISSTLPGPAIPRDRSDQACHAEAMIDERNGRIDHAWKPIGLRDLKIICGFRDRDRGFGWTIHRRLGSTIRLLPNRDQDGSVTIAFPGVPEWGHTSKVTRCSGVSEKPLTRAIRRIVASRRRPAFQRQSQSGSANTRSILTKAASSNWMPSKFTRSA